MKGLSYYYDRKRFETVEAVVEYYNKKDEFEYPGAGTINIKFCGVVVGSIDIDRLSAEVNRHASGR